MMPVSSWHALAFRLYWQSRAEYTFGLLLATLGWPTALRFVESIRRASLN